MSDFSDQVPVESEKVDWLHDRSVRPVRVFAQPSTILVIIVAIFASMALIALAFQARASWDVARDIQLNFINGISFLPDKQGNDHGKGEFYGTNIAMLSF